MFLFFRILRDFVLLSLALGVFFNATSSIGQTENDGQCVPPREQLKIPEAGRHGHYHRMHPSGNYFIFTEGRSSFVVDLTNKSNPVTYRSPAREEAYPVESASGGWDLIAAPVDGGARGPAGGMQYFRFSDLASSASASAKPTYTDTAHGEYYLSSAELPGSSRTTKKVRTLLYSDRSYRDYDFEMSSDGSIKRATPGPVKKLCQNLILPTREISASERNQMEVLSRRFTSLTYPGSLDVTAATALAEEIFIFEKQVYSHLGDAFATTRKKRNLALIDRAVADEAVKTFKPYQDALKSTREAQDNYQRAVSAIADPIRQAQRAELDRLRTEFYNARDSATRSRLEAEYIALDRQVSAAVSRAIAENEQIRNLQREVAMKQKVRMELESVGPMKASRDLNRSLRDMDEELSSMTARNMINPILSKDGTHVAGLVGGRLTVYKIDESGNCDLVLKTGYRGSKVSFSYPKQGENLKITFTAEGGPPTYQLVAHVVDTKTGKAETLSDAGDSPYYPGFLLDGRVMYRSKEGMVIVDPEARHGRKCISATSVGTTPARERKSTK